MHTISSGDDAEDEEDPDSSGGFLPFAAAAQGPSTTARADDPSATIRTPPRRRTTISERNRPSIQTRDTIISSSASSASSSAAVGAGLGGPSRTQQRPQVTADNQAALRSPISPADALSPRRRAELAKLNPRVSKKKDGSDGTPSMGSSYSDLDGECYHYILEIYTIVKLLTILVD